MKKYVKMRMICLLLCAAVLLGLLPAQAAATEVGTFVLVVETNQGLVIAPEHIGYTQGQTLKDALLASGHSFSGLENDGMVNQIDGVVGNYTRSDQAGRYAWDTPAQDITFFRFSEAEDSRPSEGLQKLMTEMAQYAEMDADVRSAAKEAYDTAYTQFVGLDSASAALLADALDQAVSEYENIQSGTHYPVSFTDGTQNHTGAEITVKNTHGKVWTDDGDGVLELPAGSYSFRVGKDGLWVEGEITVSAALTVTAPLPEELWLDRDAFRLSGSYSAKNNPDIRFEDDEYTVASWNGRETTVTVPDSFAGKLYTYAKFTPQLDQTPTLTAIYPSAEDGQPVEQALPFESYASGAANVLKRGAAGNTVIYRVSCLGSDGYTYCQDYCVNIARLPSLVSIGVSDQNGVDQAATTAFEPNVTEYTYKVLDTVTAVKVKAEPLDSSYTVTVNGEPVGQGVQVMLDADEQTDIQVAVSANGYTNTYHLSIRPGEGRKVSFVTDREDVTLEVVNSNGEVMPYQKFREGTSGNRYQYALVPGETYSYVATSAAYYHLADRFTMEDVADSTIRVSVPTEDWLTALAFGRSSAASDKGNLQMDSAFTKNDHSYQVRYEDTEHIPYVWVTGVSGVKIQAIYRQNDGFSLYHGNEKTLSLTSGKTTGEKLNRFLMDENPVENTLTIRLTKEEDGITYYQDYQVAFFRDLTLGNIRATCDGMPITLIQENREAKFDPLVKVYFLTVSMAARELELSVERYDSNRCYGEEQVGYKVAVDGADITEASTARIQLDGTIQTQTVTVTVSNEKAPSGTAEYVLHIQKSPPVETNFTVAPADALLAVYETLSGQRLWPNENGVFLFCEGYQYRYALTAYGYVSKSGVLSVQRDAQGALVVTDGTDTYPVAETAQGGGAVQIQWMLPKAQQNADLQPDMDAAWPNFRGNGENNAVVDAKIPTAADQGTLYWANQIGSGYGSDAVGSPILVDGDLITYAGNTIYRVDTVSGEVIKTGTMDHKSANATTSPSYAEGMVFVALTDGTVQAFNAETLESLWVYKDPLGGQPVCPLTIHNGYLYTGFWNNETGDANFVCLSITDEDAAQPQESKCASWYYTAKGGYYWAGAYASDDFVLVGCDDGTHTCTAQSSRLLAFDPKTGVLLDSEDGLNGDIRSTVVYDKSTDAYYFTSKGGSFYGFKMQQTADGWEIRDMWSVALENGTAATAMSTSSPVVYNGRAYVGVSGAGQMEAYSGHNITVIDISKKAIAYKANTQGYPQTSGLLTTAYEAQSGYVYIYFFDNMTPGKLRVLRDKAGQTKADYLTEENGVSMAYELFTPTGDHAQYAICSPITDEYGTIYYKNDTAYLMAFGSRVEKIEVTKKPDKMTYADGEVFDPAGMVVTATYANGMTRDVTRYVTFSPETISEDAVQITITYPFSMYHNEENGTGMDSGIPTATPVTTLTVTVAEKPEILGDVNADGKIDIRDANLVVSFRSGNVTLTQLQQKLADVDRDGKVDILDANRIIAYRFGEIQSF